MTEPSHLEGALFETVQRASVFEDSKRFVDSVPKGEPSEIARRFEAHRHRPGFDLHSFVDEHFNLASDAVPDVTVADDVSMEAHIDALWPAFLKSQTALNEYDSLLSIPNRHVVPGGRFREVYYWDSYFTALGLATNGAYETIEGLADNFASLIDRFGFVPNGNRTYYLSRSQLPVFCLLVELLVAERGVDAARPYLSQLEAEYAFWMDGRDAVSASEPTHRRVVRLDEDTLLNRYWDDAPAPRKEAYAEDLEVAAAVEAGDRRELYRNIRAACESGWDFSSRWLRDAEQFETIRTTEIVPVDLNAALYALESKLGEWFDHAGDAERATAYRAAAADRRRALERYCWDPAAGFFFDYCFTDDERTDSWSLAAATPLYFEACTRDQAAAVAETLRDRFLEAGGLLTTLSRTGEQWDAPNGWAPLQWFAVGGLRRYNRDELADEIATRWIALNRAVFRRDRKMIEKYDVTKFTLEGGGGEYPLQDGFGWTNGVVTALQARDRWTALAAPSQHRSE